MDNPFSVAARYVGRPLFPRELNEAWMSSMGVAEIPYS